MINNSLEDKWDSKFRNKLKTIWEDVNAIVKSKLDIETAYLKAFMDLPNSIETYLLDTNVWGEIAKDTSLQTAFLSHNKSNNYLAGLSIWSLTVVSGAGASDRRCSRPALLGADTRNSNG